MGRGTLKQSACMSESVLGSKGKKNTPRQVSAFNNSKLHGSVGSLPSLITADDLVEEKWVTSDQFKDILVQKEKEISDIKVCRLYFI